MRDFLAIKARQRTAIFSAIQIGKRIRIAEIPCDTRVCGEKSLVNCNVRIWCTQLQWCFVYPHPGISELAEKNSNNGCQQFLYNPLYAPDPVSSQEDASEPTQPTHRARLA